VRKTDGAGVTADRDRSSIESISPAAAQTIPLPDRLAFPVTVAIIVLLSACHAYYAFSSRIPPSTDEAHYMSGVLSIAQGIRTGTLSGIWHGYQNALNIKAPLVCVPAALLMLLVGGLTWPSMLSLVFTYALLGLASYSLFRHCFRPFHAATATTLLLTMPMVTGLVHRFYVELLLVLLCVVYLDVLARQPWRSASRSAVAGLVLGLGTLSKVSFPGLVILPTLYSVWVAVRERRPEIRLVQLLSNGILAVAVAALVAASWYVRNGVAVLQHARAATACCYGPRWIAADISAGPWFAVFCVAAVGFPLVVSSLLKRRYRDRERQSWILILLLGFTTVFVTVLATNKATRFTVTWLPMLACLAVAAWQQLPSLRWSRLGLIAMILVSTLLALNTSFGMVPLPSVHFAGIQVIDSHFPLNVPGWFNDNHPLDRRRFRLEEAEAILARDAKRNLLPGHLAQARITVLGLLVDFDYFQLLAAARRSPVQYGPWCCDSNLDPEMVDYILRFDGFEKLYPGAMFFNYYPSLQTDVLSGKLPYRVLSHLEGPSKTGIWIYAKVPPEPSRGPEAAVPKRREPELGDLFLEAERFDRGNVVGDFKDWGRTIGVIVTPQAPTSRVPAFAEYDFVAPAAGDYQIEVRYASGAPRPVMLSVDNALLSRTAAGGVTGGFLPANQRQEPVAVVRLEQGKHTLRLESHAVFPHIDGILLSRRR